MSNNKQSSLDYYITKSTEILGTEIIKQISRDDNERIARLEKQAKEMEKEQKQKYLQQYFEWHKSMRFVSHKPEDIIEFNNTYGGNK